MADLYTVTDMKEVTLLSASAAKNHGPERSLYSMILLHNHLLLCQSVLWLCLYTVLASHSIPCTSAPLNLMSEDTCASILILHITLTSVDGIVPHRGKLQPDSTMPLDQDTGLSNAFAGWKVLGKESLWYK
jgi:hypothetical protein